MSNLIDLPPLFKRASGGAVQVWEVRVDPHDDGTASIISRYGQVDGQKQEAVDHIKVGKNPGKKNETTATQQAIKEASAKWSKRLDRKHYGHTVEESDIKIAAAPMLAHPYDDHANKVDWTNKHHLHVQPKFDGHRCLAFCDDKMEITLYSREGVEIETTPHIVEQLHPIMYPGVILDGELYIHGMPLNKIASLIKRAQAGSENLCFMTYDISDPKKSFADRFQTLSQDYMDVSLEAPHIHLAKTQAVDSLGEADEFQAACLEAGYEGAMLRHGLSGYKPGKRSDGLLKMKTFVDDEFVIVGCKEGNASYEGMAIFECVTADGNKFDVTSPGTHEEKRAAWVARDSYMGKRLTVKYQFYTKTDAPVPFLPVAKSIIVPLRG